MRLEQEFYRLPFRFDAARLAAEALNFPEEAWRAHPSNFGGNTALILVSANGGINDDLSGPMKPTMHLASAPYMRRVMTSFGAVVGRSRLMRLAPGATVPEHTDIDYYWRSHFRIHVPVVTHPSVRFYCNQKWVHMAAGEAWTFDNWQTHKVQNPSNVTRIHLVMDTVGTAALWRLMKRSAAGGLEERFVAYRPADAADALVTEHYDSPPVAPPSEIDALGRELIEDIRLNPANDSAAVDSLAEAIDELRADWRCQWLVHGPAESGWAEYRQLLQAFTAVVTALPPLVVASNGITAQDIVHAQFCAAFAVDKVSEPSRPAPSRAAPMVPAAARPAAAAIQPEAAFDRTVIIVAAPRSGSTMLFEALAENREFWTVGDESHHIIEGISGLRPADRGFASNRLLAADAEGGMAAVLRRAFSAELRNSSGVAWCDLALAARTTPLRFLEKTPKNALRIPFLAAVFPDALFIFLHRNPRDNISGLIDSWRSGRFVMYPQLPGWSGLPWSHLLIPGWRGLEGRALAEVVGRQWQVTNETILTDLATLPRHRWTAVSYEELIVDPVGELRRLCCFADVPFEPRMQELTRRPLKPSRYTLAPPSPEKWRHNEAELIPVLPATEALAEQLRRLQTSEALAPDVSGDVGPLI
jgi:hypothetical protein